MTLDPAAPDPTTFDAPEPWRVSLGEAFSQLAPEPLQQHRDPAGKLSGSALGRVGMFNVSGTPQVVRRTLRAVRRTPAEHIKVCVQLRGRAIVHQDDREVTLRPGQLAIYDTGREYALRLDGLWNCAVMAVPRDQLGLRGQDLNAVMYRPYRADQGPGLVLADFVVAAAGLSPSTSPLAAARIAEAGTSLLIATLTDGDPTTHLSPDNVRDQVTGYIHSHLDDPRLSRASIAAAHNISVRTLDRLFAHDSQSVSALIRTERLDAVRRDLENPLLRHRSVAALAARWCFVDPAHFSRLFRGAYGYPPSQRP